MQDDPLTVDDLNLLVIERPCRGTVGAGFFRDLAPRMPAMTGPMLSWFTDALRDEDRKWVAAALLASHPESAKPLVRDLIRAAIVELDPSFNRAFVLPLANNIDWPEAADIMLEIAEAGGDTKRGGVGRASYWLGADLSGADSDTSIRVNSWKMREFLRSTDTYAQRCLIAGLRFESALLDDATKPLRDEAIDKAYSHEDEYIRHRLAIQLGESGGPYEPLLR